MYLLHVFVQVSSCSAGIYRSLFKGSLSSRKKRGQFSLCKVKQLIYLSDQVIQQLIYLMTKSTTTGAVESDPLNKPW